MIIGKGLIAQSLQNIDSHNIIFFASGVSNSLETNEAEFLREFQLLENTIKSNPSKKLIYFSTLSIEDKTKQESPYVLHKKAIEKHIQATCNHYLILRIGNIIGHGGNPNTLFNFMRTKLEASQKFLVHKNARRLLIDIDDIKLFLEKNRNIRNQQIINMAFPYHYSMLEMIDAMEKISQKKAIFDTVDEGDLYAIDFSEEIITYFKNTSPADYLKSVTKKYL